MCHKCHNAVLSLARLFVYRHATAFANGKIMGYHWDRIKNPPLRTISSRFWAKVLIFWKFSPNSEFQFLFFWKLFLKIFACGAKIHIPNFRLCRHFYLVYRPKTMQNRSQNFSPAAQNEPLLVLRFLFFGKYFGKVPILLKISSNLESTGS